MTVTSQAEGWSAVAGLYDEMLAGSTLPFAQRAYEFAAVPETNPVACQPLAILDVACGPGPLLESVAKRAAPTLLLATDFAPGMVDLVKQKIRNEGWDGRMRALVMDAMALDLPDASQDIAFCLFGVMLIPNGIKSLSEMHRVLRPNGIITISTWAAQDTWSIMADTTRRLGIPFTPPSSPAAAAAAAASWHDRTYLETTLRATGFRNVTSTQQDGVFVLDENFITMMVLNPAFKAFMTQHAWTDDQQNRYPQVFREACEAWRETHPDGKLNVTANIVRGEK
ncbi:S-adenosyl-L-methionine-dependent methyltransferase [Powellomyces hirtus]|nr:S-adenosyl-L-methionine-dependent methyltransferase [Powellomyces hirtus]